ncbi:MAG: heavy metal translocating P-type ATPase metal-binding domain-containing protein [Calditrichia bacterium]
MPLKDSGLVEAPEKSPVTTDVACYHCGLPCADETVHLDEKAFCCNGCKMVYEILNENDLCQYYDLNENPGARPKAVEMPERFAYLDDETIQQKLTDFRDDRLTKVTFYIPSIRCSSCLWLLENLYKINPAFSQSKVDFLRKELSVTFRHTEISLRQTVELLASLGYEPLINLDGVGNQQSQQRTNRSLYIKIGVAGFCFGNIMLLSFPEYLAIGDTITPGFRRFFGVMNILLSLPVLFYSAIDYLKSAYASLRHRAINIDVPLSLGILAMFGRSLIEILWYNSAGYMDSFAGLVFLLLIGKIFQQKTYDNLSFERDYKSFFPIAITRKTGNSETSIPLEKLEVGDRVVVRHQELIPADSVLINGDGMIDYSFVTGEAEPVAKHSGDLVYAGGRQVGSAIEMEVVKDVSQSYLTQLWNNDVFGNPDAHNMNSFVNSISKYFTIAILSIATIAGIFWLQTDVTLALNAFTAVLIIACPCALALSTPFTLGNVLRIFGRNQFYLKNTQVVENLAKINSIVFDKTGTITQPRSADVQFVSLNGRPDLSNDHQMLVKSLVKHSTHPLSFNIFHSIQATATGSVEGYLEKPGLGITGTVNGHELKVGSKVFIGGNIEAQRDNASQVFVSIDGQVKGYFNISNSYRTGLRDLIDRLSATFRLSLISGDNDRERENLQQFFGETAELRFSQSPQQKLEYISSLQHSGAKVLMIGDGLNDAGALKQSDVGISISEDLNSFSPACDAILNANAFERLGDFMRFSRTGMNVIRFNLLLSLLYNIVGLSFAVSGTLSPLICAILMPISSISVIAIASGATGLLGRRYGLWQ